MKKMQCDIAVIGGGGSGLVAGCRAATLGKSVIVLEKEKALGGGMNMASTLRTFGSRWQKERNLPDTTALYMRNRMDETYWRLDRKLAASMIRGTGEFFDWFCEIAPQDVVDQFTVGRYVFDDESDGPLGPQAGGHGTRSKGSGRLFVEVCSQKLQELGGQILTKAITDELTVTDGKVTGLKAHVDGEEIEISCSAVILACGAWIRNQEFVQEHYPLLADVMPGMRVDGHTSLSYTGDGLKLAEAAGAKMDTKNLTIRMMGPMTMCRSRVMSDMSSSAYSIYINNTGRRYISECSQLRMGVFDSGSVLLEQPMGQAYVIFDKNTLRHTIADGKNQPQPQLAMPFGPANFPDTLEEAEAEMEPALEACDGVVFRADTVADLAAAIGVDAEALQQTIADYNAACETGMDWDCYKPAEWLVPLNEAPYYAVKTSLGTDGAFGGVEINEHMQVKAASGGVVDGLYCVGDLASGRFINMTGIKKQILNDMSFAVSSGYVAGTHAAGA